MGRRFRDYMFSIRVILFLICVLMMGCKISHGPKFKNNTEREVNVWIYYNGGRCDYVKLLPGVSFLQGNPDLVLDSLVVVQDGRRFDFESKFIHELLGGVKELDDAIVAFDGHSLNVLASKGSNGRDGYHPAR